MSSNQEKNSGTAEESKWPAADTGNASNPSPHSGNAEPGGSHQLLNEQAEKYLREAGNIEDMPDAQEEEEAEEMIDEENKDQAATGK